MVKPLEEEACPRPVLKRSEVNGQSLMQERTGDWLSDLKDRGFFFFKGTMRDVILKKMNVERKKMEMPSCFSFFFPTRFFFVKGHRHSAVFSFFLAECPAGWPQRRTSVCEKEDLRPFPLLAFSLFWAKRGPSGGKTKRNWGFERHLKVLWALKCSFLLMMASLRLSKEMKDVSLRSLRWALSLSFFL